MPPEMVQPSSPVQLIASLREGAWFKFYNDDRMLGTFAGGRAVVFKPTNSVSSRKAPHEQDRQSRGSWLRTLTVLRSGGLLRSTGGCLDQTATMRQCEQLPT